MKASIRLIKRLSSEIGGSAPPPGFEDSDAARALHWQNHSGPPWPGLQTQCCPSLVARSGAALIVTNFGNKLLARHYAGHYYCRATRCPVQPAARQGYLSLKRCAGKGSLRREALCHPMDQDLKDMCFQETHCPTADALHSKRMA